MQKIRYKCDVCETFDVRMASEQSEIFKDPKCVNCDRSLRVI
ncbi:hypothetical protein [Nitrosopumilus ureiphilus]|nr:hypothetical protein [Nitrosopumilus ureiphilus]